MECIWIVIKTATKNNKKKWFSNEIYIKIGSLMGLTFVKSHNEPAAQMANELATTNVSNPINTPPRVPSNCVRDVMNPQYPDPRTPIVCQIIINSWKKKMKKKTMKLKLESSRNALYAGRYLQIKWKMLKGISYLEWHQFESMWSTQAGSTQYRRRAYSRTEFRYNSVTTKNDAHCHYHYLRLCGCAYVWFIPM